jgi:Transcriptional regulators
MAPDLDDTDRGILHLLQLDARNTTAQEIGDQTGVSSSTVRNRIQKLENRDVIMGYHPSINYEAANLPLTILFVITAASSERLNIVESIMGIIGVVDIRETLSDRRNLYVEAVGTSTSDLDRLSDEIHALGLDIERSEIVKQRRIQPFDHFYQENHVDDTDDRNGSTDTEST